MLPDDDQSDVSVVQTVLALNAELGDLSGLPVVAEVNDAATAERLVQACGPTDAPDRHRPGDRHERRRSPFGNAASARVVAELLDFRGCDLHVADRPELIGLRFDDIVGRFANARPLGISTPTVASRSTRPPSRSSRTAIDSC